MSGTPRRSNGLERHISHGPHRGAVVLAGGLAVDQAAGVAILLHGRGGSAEDALRLGGAISPASFALLAPQAEGNTWYPQSFMAPRELNEPWLSSALAMIEALVRGLEERGVPRSRVVVAGFSQGACLATEFLASHPARYAGLFAFTGGLIGPEGTNLVHGGSLEGTPAFFFSGDPDPHVPWSRVEESAAELRRMGALVETRRFPGRPHVVSGEEIRLAQAAMASMASVAPER